MPKRRAPEDTARENITEAARGYGDPTDLVDAALRRLAWRLARSAKRCEKCRATKPLSAFGRDVAEPDGLNRKCRECRRIGRVPAVR